ncbi:hypothetical protein M0R89_21325 (plasmid) [Halorussus limi]|uniref:Uncharacterized protein n=1 Tax=Halorussus limi TaxID=2938695 RepID=A0A8U0I0N7_9EURY|nr:hypothetical protein [Halorussus limi]UPV76738.1 hypothetical protein M0R89_21325 [Halorussus limi]
MSGQTVRSGVGTRDKADYLTLAANVVYALAGIMFLAGLYFDWRHSGQILIEQFALADEPNANSGLFILAIIVLALGYLLSVLGNKLEEWQTEKVDQTQEWTVDVGED